MRRSLLFSALLVLAACFPSAASASPERYIVVLKDGVSDSAQVASEHSRRYGASVGFVYGHALKGYSATIPSERVAALRADSRVDYVVHDGVASAVAQTLPWGIDRINADASSTLAGNGSGAVTNVRAYVIDSGIAAHPDLNLTGHVNFANGQNTDCNGHGTHVAGTIAARDNTSDVVGVAPGAPLTGVKVLGCSGSGSWSGVIKGIDWVTANATKPAVANMSLGGGANQAVDDAVRRSADSGVFYALAAGNEGANACNSSPARAGAGIANGIVTTAATDSSDREASWSNFGSCVDIWSPGVSILSTRRGGGTTTMSGTSMASPHSAGAGALYLSTHSANPAAVESALTGAAQSTGTSSKDRRAIYRLYVGGF
jgi:aqualysin 1